MHTSMTAVASSAEAMGRVSAAMDPAKVAHTAQEFAKQNARMEMAGDVMDDAMEDMFEVGEDEADDLVNQERPPPLLLPPPAAPCMHSGRPTSFA